ncbi:hypothetical protein [Pseudoblastomonas flavescens]|uniref:hypothetical protein n=1 Tax=Alteriqipengyuania flavescens TaxID=3053610 RepID=UPI0025B5284B|nr:hypothetical protein [Alteriqipengyuania flavescens]WJY20104.1 hypothetical protein QQW98_08090 [Alteriqipengyuania flavescens]
MTAKTGNPLRSAFWFFAARPLHERPPYGVSRGESSEGRAVRRGFDETTVSADEDYSASGFQRSRDGLASGAVRARS